MRCYWLPHVLSVEEARLLAAVGLYSDHGTKHLGAIFSFLNTQTFNNQ